MNSTNQPDKQSSNPVLTLGHFRLSFRSKETINLPQYVGSAWRGLFGHSLKQAVCVTRMANCKACLLYHGCPYSYVFETPPPVDTERMRKYTALPHPFIIFPLPAENRTLEADSVMQIELVVCGRALQYLPYMVYAFQLAGGKGIGRERGTFELHRVEQNISNVLPESWEPIMYADSPMQSTHGFVSSPPPCPDEVLVTFDTPMRVKRDGHLVGAEEFEFHDLFRSLLRRIAMLIYFHENRELDVNFAELISMAKRLTVSKKNLQWLDWTRYSSRQNTSMQMGGLVGSFSLHQQDLQAFWPFLWLGQWTHAGKGASMGLGHYRLGIPASLPNQRKRSG